MEDKYFLKILNKVLAYISYSSRTEQQVSTKLDSILSKSSLSETDIEVLKQKIIAELHTSKLLNDAEYAQAFIATRISGVRPVGRNMLAKQLQKRGVPNSIIQDTLSTIDPGEEKLAVEKLFQRKHRQLDYADDLKSKQKIIRYLLGRGCTPSLVYALVDSKFKVK